MDDIQIFILVKIIFFKSNFTLYFLCCKIDVVIYLGGYYENGKISN